MCGQLPDKGSPRVQAKLGKNVQEIRCPTMNSRYADYWNTNRLLCPLSELKSVINTLSFIGTRIGYSVLHRNLKRLLCRLSKFKTVILSTIELKADRITVLSSDKRQSNRFKF